jgi:glycerophosphoryl diester phosphodiesterase
VTVLRPHPALIAERGNCEEFPENTLPAVTSALALGIHHILVDVQLSSDGVPMLANEAGLLRTAGIDRSVLHMTAAELSHTCVGESRRFGGLFGDVGMAMLADAVGLLGVYEDAALFVDLKHASVAHFGHEQVVQAVAESCRHVRQRCVIVSADLPVVYRARQAYGFKIGWRIDGLDSHTQLKYQALAPDYLLLPRNATPEQGYLPRGPWQWIVTDVSTGQQSTALTGRAVSLIMTRRLRTLQATGGQV